MKKIHYAVTELVGPSTFRCMRCGRDLYGRVGFCEQCMKPEYLNNGNRCARCGMAVKGEASYCGHCAIEGMSFDKGYSPLCYLGAVRTAILDFKFNRRATYARPLAYYLVYEAQAHNLQFDIVTFVPISAKTYKKRHYNQAQLLAQQFCDILDINALLCETIVKVRETPPQEGLYGKQRLDNLNGCFRFREGADVKGKRVLLIDDVKTTGATANGCARVLKRHGAAEVIVLTVASGIDSMQYEIKE